MGFECSFNKVKKYKDITLKDFLVIESYIDWKNNPWNLKEDHYPDFEKYWNSFNSDFMGPYPGIPDAEAVAFYESLPKGEYALAETVDFWCSPGRYIDNFVTAVLDDNKVTEYDFEITGPDFIAKALEWVNDELDDCGITKAYVLKAYKDNEDGSTTLFPCDGFLFMDEFGNQNFISTSDDEFGEPVYIPSKFFDEDKYETLVNFKDTLTKLATIDTNEYFVWYGRSF